MVAPRERVAGMIGGKRAASSHRGGECTVWLTAGMVVRPKDAGWTVMLVVEIRLKGAVGSNRRGRELKKGDLAFYVGDAANGPPSHAPRTTLSVKRLLVWSRKDGGCSVVLLETTR